MATHYEILPPEQRRLLPEIAQLRELGFVLYGGTAIALHLGHRASIDFDFFTDRRMDRDAMRKAAPLLRDAVTLQDERDSWAVQTRTKAVLDRPVKLSFFADLSFGRVGKPKPDDDGNVLVASLDDLLGHKLKVLLQRVELKDYQDIASMLRAGQSLAHGLGAAKALFSNFPPCEALKALVYFDDDLRALSKEDRATLVAHADRAESPTTVSILSHALT